MSQEYRLKEQPWNNMHVLYVICVLPWDAKVPTLFSCYYKLNGEGCTTIKYLQHNQVTFLHVSYAITSSPFLVHDSSHSVLSFIITRALRLIMMTMHVGDL